MNRNRLRNAVLCAGVMSALLFGTTLAKAGSLPDLPEYPPRFGKVCQSGPLVRVGLTSASKVIVRAEGGLKIGGRINPETLVVEAVPWVGAVYVDSRTAELSASAKFSAAHSGSQTSFRMGVHSPLMQTNPSLQPHAMSTRPF